MINAVVAGAAGRMGGRIIHMIQESKEIKLAGAFERPDHPSVGKDVGQVVGLGDMGIELKGDIEQTAEGADVLIDFTTPESTLKNFRFISKTGQAIVIGTTGISDEINQELNQLAKRIKCVLAPNMSIGVNVMFKVVKDLSKILSKGYDMEVIEYHHRLKKDAPSGTAMHIAKVLADTTGRNFDTDLIYQRKGFVGVRKDEEIGIQSIRAGDIVGEHTTIFAGVGERIEITHRAHSRDNFARGALLAAMWIMEQPNGIYDMQDVLGLKEKNHV